MEVVTPPVGVSVIVINGISPIVTFLPDRVSC